MLGGHQWFTVVLVNDIVPGLPAIVFDELTGTGSQYDVKFGGPTVC
jgi:hypothetical protein